MKLLLALIFLFSPAILLSDIINVPADFDIIQDAVDNAANQDTILVQPGTYTDAIVFDSTRIILGSLYLLEGDESYISRTILDGENEHRPLTLDFEDDERGVVISGFTITNGLADYGGGIYSFNFNSIIDNLVITGNHASIDGGGIYVQRESQMSIHDVTVINNSAGSQGGGVHFHRSSMVLMWNCIIEGNRAESGGGMYVQRTSNVMFNQGSISNNYARSSGGGVYCTHMCEMRFIGTKISDNIADWHLGGGIYNLTSIIDLYNVTLCNNLSGDEDCGGVYLTGTCELLVMNSILWNNEHYQIYIHGESDPLTLVTVSYSDVEEGQDSVFIDNNAEVEWLDGNINEDPLFVNADWGDYHLTAASPCIDAGDPDSGEDPDGSDPDMGAIPYDPEYSVFEDTGINLPNSLDLLEVYPNPFNSTVSIRYGRWDLSPVSVQIFDLKGRTVKRFGDDEISRIGRSVLEWNADGLAAGIYVVSVTAGVDVLRAKVLLLR